MSSSYNKMHEKLVKNKKDFSGMIAYSIYKTEKRDAIRKGRDIDEFTKLKLQTNEVKKYKSEADELVNLFLQAAADEEIKRVKEQLTKEINQITVKGLPADPWYTKIFKWHNSGTSGIVGNFWTGAIVAGFVWIMAEQGAWDAAKESAQSAASKLVGSQNSTQGSADTNKELPLDQ